MIEQALELVTVALLVYLIADKYSNRYRFDPQYIANHIAARLLNDYGGELHRLNESGARQYTRELYIQLCTEAGLPTAALDRIEAAVWEVIAQAQPDFVQGDGVTLYE